MLWRFMAADVADLIMIDVFEEHLKVGVSEACFMDVVTGRTSPPLHSRVCRAAL